MTTRGDSEDDPVEREPPQKREVAYNVGQEAASTMPFSTSWVFPRQRSINLLFVFCRLEKISETIPKALKLITAVEGYSCTHMRRQGSILLQREFE